MIIIRKIEEILFKILSILTVFCFLSLCVTVFIQVFARLFLPTSPIWTEELSRYIFIYLLTFGSGLAYIKNEFVSVEILPNKLKGKYREAYSLAVHLTVAVFSSILISYAYEYMLIGAMQTSPAISMPMQYMYVTTIIIFCNFLIFSSIKILLIVSSLLSKSSQTSQTKEY